MDQAGGDAVESWEQTARFINLVLPIGWLPLGVMAAAEGNIGPAILGLLGMTLLGAISLWRAYRTTLRLYRGEFTSRRAGPASAVAKSAPARKPGDRQRSKQKFRGCPSRCQPSRWRACVRSCGHPRRKCCC